MRRPFGAVLLIAFGGPTGRADVRPFLGNVLRGRDVPQERIDDVAQHYEIFDGVSPLTELTRRQAAGLRERLETRGPDLPVYVGMRNWHPFLEETLRQMRNDGVARAIGLIAAAHRSYSSCLQYQLNVARADADVGARITLAYAGDWHTHPGFIAAMADRIWSALDRVPADERAATQLVFTAHSIPVSMAARYPYEQQLHQTAQRIGHELGMHDWTLVFQSRSGRSGEPWLGPDISEYLRLQAAVGTRRVVVAPIGFVCDHIEVLYDLDHEAAQAAEQAGIRMVRAQAVNDHPVFLDALADVVRQTWARYERGIALPIVSSTPPTAEPAPPYG
jgi:ferrochelatase